MGEALTACLTVGQVNYRGWPGACGARFHRLGYFQQRAPETWGLWVSQAVMGLETNHRVRNASSVWYHAQVLAWQRCAWYRMGA